MGKLRSREVKCPSRGILASGSLPFHLFSLRTVAAVRGNSKQNTRVKRGRNMVDSPHLHNVKKIAFANYHSLKAIRVFGGNSGHKQK